MPKYDFTETIEQFTKLLEHVQEVWGDPKQRKKAEEAVLATAKDLANRYYWFYLWYTNKGVWIPGAFHRYIAEAIQEFLERPTTLAYEILIIEAPPQHGKSMSATEAAPAWCAGKWPDDTEILISYNDDTALRFTKSNKEKIAEYGKQLFDIEIETGVGKIDRMDEFSLVGHRFHLISRGLGGGITSHGAKRMFIDDPIKSSAEADSEVERERQWMEWNTTLKTRLAAGAKVVLILTRWNEDDLAGRIEANEPPEAVTIIRMPCEAEENDPLGRPAGAALCPEIGKGDEWLAQFKKGFLTDSGTRAWNALFQGRPTSLEGNMFKRHYWRYWQPADSHLPPVKVKLPDGTTEERIAEPFPDWIDERVQSWDCTFKDTKNTDRVSGGNWERRGACIYLTDHRKDRMDILRTMTEIEAMARRHPKALEKLIEDKANGPAVIQMLRRKVFGMVAINPDGGKVARANAILPAVEAGNVYLPHPQLPGCSWVYDYIEEMASFPNGKFDDDVDMTTQALNRLIHRTGTRDPGRHKPVDRSPEALAARHLERVNKEHKFGKKPVYV